jgi:hypothetical protein
MFQRQRQEGGTLGGVLDFSTRTRCLPIAQSRRSSRSLPVPSVAAKEPTQARLEVWRVQAAANVAATNAQNQRTANIASRCAELEQVNGIAQSGGASTRHGGWACRDRNARMTLRELTALQRAICRGFRPGQCSRARACRAATLRPRIESAALWRSTLRRALGDILLLTTVASVPP